MDAYVWFGLFIAFIIMEIAVPGLVSIWFALASGILSLTAKYIESPMNEIYLFICLSIIFLLATKPLSKKILSKRTYKMEDRIIGQIVIIDKVFENGDFEVRLDGKFWKAKSKDILEVGSRGTVKVIEGNKLILEKE